MIQSEVPTIGPGFTPTNIAQGAICFSTGTQLTGNSSALTWDNAALVLHLGATIGSGVRIATSGDPFAIHSSDAVFHSQTDHVLHYSYNILEGTNGVAIDASEPTCEFTLESHDFSDGVNHHCEWNFNYNNAGNTVSRRPLALKVNRVSNVGEIFVQGITFQHNDDTGATTYFKTQSTGCYTVDGAAGTPSFSFISTTNRGIGNNTSLDSSGALSFQTSGGEYAALSTVAFYLANGVSLGFSGGNANIADLFLVRDGANIAALKRTTNAQTFRVYGNATGAKYVSLAHDGTNGAINTTAGNLGIFTTTPRVAVDVLSTAGAQVRATYTDNSVFTDLLTNSSGYFSLSPSGLRTGIGTTAPNELVEINHASRTLLRWSTNSASLGWIGNADALLSGGSSTDFAILAQNGWELGVSAGTRALTVTTAGFLRASQGSNGQYVSIEKVTELTTIAAAASTNTAIQIPVNAVVFAVSVRVVTVIPTAATFTVTGTTSGTQFDVAGGVNVAANTTDVGTRNCPFKNGAAQTITITPNINPATATGQVRVTIHYYAINPPTS